MKTVLYLLTCHMPLYLMPCVLAQDGPPLTIEEALQRGLARTDLASIRESRLALAESDVLQAAKRDNPQLNVSTERIDQVGVSTREDYFLVSQKVVLFGIRDLKTRAARHRTQMVRWENQSHEWDVRAQVQKWFYEVLYARARISVLESWETNFTNIAKIVAVREQAGEVSGYDRRRFLLELAEARAATASGRAAWSGQWERLRTFLEIDVRRPLVGTLMPPSGPWGPEPSPELGAFDEAMTAAALEEEAAHHWRLPELTIEAGLKRTRFGSQTDTGFFVSARIPIPVYKRHAAVLEARSQGELARAQKALTLAENLGASRALETQIKEQRNAVESFRATAIPTARELVDIAQAAYRAGEADITALLDAYRSMRDTQLQALALEAETRRLWIERMRLGGMP